MAAPTRAAPAAAKAGGTTFPAPEPGTTLTGTAPGAELAAATATPFMLVGPASQGHDVMTVVLRTNVCVTPLETWVDNTGPPADEGAMEGYEYTDDRGTRDTGAGAEDGGMEEGAGAGA
jgi:hypothetical protein